MLEQLESIQAEGVTTLGQADTAEKLEQWRVAYLAKNGKLPALMSELGKVPKADKPVAGQKLNELKKALTSAFEQRKKTLGTTPKAVKTAGADVTEPGLRPRRGRPHVITQTIRELTEIFGRMGFEVATGPEVEDEWHNFIALNIPQDHPARDPLENFYLDANTLLRSQTSTIQIRVMAESRPPVRVVAFGRVYRPDTVDATHFPMFHQIEGLYVDEGVSMIDLRTTVDLFCKTYFGPEVTTRFRPSFFPFTEPSAEVDMTCMICHGSGKLQDGRDCSACSSGWIELGGCGMVDPNVLKSVGHDPDRYSGWAFGLGIERMAMRKWGITDIRLLFENDRRFLEQF